jgi:hypothetical protein
MGVHDRLLQARLYGTEKRALGPSKRPLKWGEHPDHHEAVAAAMKFSETKLCAACQQPIEPERLEVLPDTGYCSKHAGQGPVAAPPPEAMAVNSENTRNGFGPST